MINKSKCVMYALFSGKMWSRGSWPPAFCFCGSYFPIWTSLMWNILQIQSIFITLFSKSLARWFIFPDTVTTSLQCIFSYCNLTSAFDNIWSKISLELKLTKGRQAAQKLKSYILWKMWRKYYMKPGMRIWKYCTCVSSKINSFDLSKPI